MTDWTTCLTVERIPGKVGGAWVFIRHADSLVRALRKLTAGATVDDFVNWFPASTGNRFALCSNTKPGHSRRI